jgi:hypothetical protein
VVLKDDVIPPELPTLEDIVTSWKKDLEECVFLLLAGDCEREANDLLFSWAVCHRIQIRMIAVCFHLDSPEAVNANICITSFRI